MKTKNNKIRTREKVTMGVLFGLLSLLAIGGVFAAVADNNTATAQPGPGRGYGLNDGFGQGYGPRDGSGYGRGSMMRGFASGNGAAGCPMISELERQGFSSEDIAKWHAELIENGKMGPGAMRALLESKGVDTSNFPAVGWRQNK